MNILNLSLIQDENEQWKPVTYPNIKNGYYLISNYGRVYSLINNRQIYPNYDKDGYKRIELVSNKKGKKVHIHRLVANEYCEKKQNKNIINHRNGIKTDNYYKNLEYCTVKENQNHAIELGLLKIQGIDNGNCKFSEDIVHTICKHISDGLSNIDICKKMGFDHKRENIQIYDLIRHIRNKTTWNHISSLYF